MKLGLIVKRGDAEDPGNYKGIIPLHVIVVGKLFYRTLAW